MPELGLFPLPIVLVPTERIPLHVFEPRYKELINECIADGAEFGLVLAAGDGAVHEIGTRARVVEVLEELADGRLNVLVEGGERFRLVELTSGRAFATGLVEDVVDAVDDADEEDCDRALELFRDLVATAEAPVDVPDRDARMLDFELAARVDFGVEAKQQILATVSPRERMKRLVALLDTALEALRLERQAQTRAAGNGRVVPIDLDG